jgi:hypothetical protein
MSLTQNEDFFVSWIYLFFFGSKSNYLSFEDLEGKEEFHLLLHLVGGSDRHAKAKEEKKVEKKNLFLADGLTNDHMTSYFSIIFITLFLFFCVRYQFG